MPLHQRHSVAPAGRSRFRKSTLTTLGRASGTRPPLHVETSVKIEIPIRLTPLQCSSIQSNTEDTSHHSWSNVETMIAVTLHAPIHACMHACIHTYIHTYSLRKRSVSLARLSAMSLIRQDPNQSGCRHASLTFAGSNQSQTRLTCTTCRQAVFLLYHGLPEDLLEEALARRRAHCTSTTAAIGSEAVGSEDRQSSATQASSVPNRSRRGWALNAVPPPGRRQIAHNRHPPMCCPGGAPSRYPAPASGAPAEEEDIQESAEKDIQESAEKDIPESAEEDMLQSWPWPWRPDGGSRSSGGSNDGGADAAAGHDGGADQEPQSQDPKPPWPGLETTPPWPASRLLNRQSRNPRPPPAQALRLPELSWDVGKPSWPPPVYFCIQCHTKPSWNGEANEHCSTQCRDRAVQGV